jgi:hypothetical protein
MLKIGFGGTWFSTLFGTLFGTPFANFFKGMGLLLLRLAPFLLQ